MHGPGATCFVQQMRALSALVRKVPVKEFPLQCPWCVPLPVPVVRFFLVLHMYSRSVLQYCTQVQKRADTNEPRTNEIPFNIKDLFLGLNPSIS